MRPDRSHHENGRTTKEESTMLTSLLKLFLFGIIGIVAISLILGLVGLVLSITFGIVGFLLFKVAPILLVGWLVLRLIDRGRNRQRLSAADQRWLDGDS